MLFCRIKETNKQYMIKYILLILPSKLTYRIIRRSMDNTVGNIFPDGRYYFKTTGFPYEEYKALPLETKFVCIQQYVEGNVILKPIERNASSIITVIMVTISAITALLVFFK